MRILLLPTGARAVPEVLALAAEIGRFNAEIDFRLRFLDVEVAPRYAAPEACAGALQEGLPEAAISVLPDGSPLTIAACLAVLLERERPDLLVVAGSGEVAEAGEAAAGASGVRWARFGPAGAGGPAGAIELGGDAGAAIERMTGMAREIR